MVKLKMGVRLLIRKEGDPKKKFKTKLRVDSDGTEHRVDVIRKKGKKTETYHSVRKNGKLVHRDRKS